MYTYFQHDFLSLFQGGPVSFNSTPLLIHFWEIHSKQVFIGQERLFLGRSVKPSGLWLTTVTGIKGAIVIGRRIMMSEGEAWVVLNGRGR